MSEIEKTWLASPSRRKALLRMAGFVAASPVVAFARPDPMEPLSTVRRTPALSELRDAYDFEPIFEGNLPASSFEYTSHGDGTEYTLRRNREAFDWVDIVSSRAAIPISQVDLSSELFGVKMKFPILVAPSADQNGIHPEGEIGMFKGAATAEMIDILAGASGRTVAAALKTVPNGTMWAQHYPIQNLDSMQRSLENIQTAGVSTIVVTCDQQASVYERTLMLRNLGGNSSGGMLQGGGNAAAVAAAAAAATATHGSVRYRVSDRRLWYSWQYIDAVRKVVTGKMIIKGVLNPLDAMLAIDHGADAIIVSNHGGRSMDYGPSTLEVLPEIVAVVNDRIPVLIDSGFRRGDDVFKALALGAKGVCLGRAARWGLGAYGSAGAQRVFEIIQQELLQTAAATGCARLSDINTSSVSIRSTP